MGNVCEPSCSSRKLDRNRRRDTAEQYPFAETLGDALVQDTERDMEEALKPRSMGAGEPRRSARQDLLQPIGQIPVAVARSVQRAGADTEIFLRNFLAFEQRFRGA
jgi:hypothetical protein